MIDKETEQFYTERGEEWAGILPHEIGPRLEPFLDRLPQGAFILDLGCGDGRDAQHMEARGFNVDATDGVAKMVELASKRLGQPARQMLFEDLDAHETYDAIWAQASLQHAPAEQLPDLLNRVWRALKPGGWHFSSFKGGDGGHRDDVGRFFSFISEDALRAAYGSAGVWSVFELDTEMGGSFGSGKLPWHNVLMRKEGGV